DGQPRARDVRAAGEADALAASELPAPLRVVRRALQRIEAFTQTHRSDAEVVDGAAVRRLQDRLPVLERIEAEVLGDLVDLAFKPVARLRRAMPALRTARGLVRIDPDAVELVCRDAVGDREQRAGVIGGRDAVRRVGAAVEPALVVHGGDLAVLLDAGADAHLHRMPAAMRVEDLLAVERDLHRTARADRKQRGRELVAERIALAAERAAVRRRDDADARARQPEHLLKLAVKVVGDLRRGPE